jgi:(p)ppGpp synthase/HD superfamily hydrolase
MYGIMHAKIFATAAHLAVGQKRKYTGEDYIVHPKAVADIVASVTDSVEMIQAAWLHDVVEDTEVTHVHIYEIFGGIVGSLVHGLTDSGIQGNRKFRKDFECARLGMCSPEVQTIKLADLIHNTSSIVNCDPNFAKVYMVEKRFLLDVLVNGNSELYSQACTQVEEYFACT